MPSKTIQLIQAASRGDFRKVASLLGDGAQVNGLGKDGAGALLGAVSNLAFFKKRVVRGRLVRCRIVSLEAVYKTVRLLLRAGADPDSLHDDYGTPLLNAAAAGNLPVVRMLIEAGARPNLQNHSGLSPLARAVFSGHKKIVGYLLAHGADPRLKDVDGQSVREAARFSLQRGARYRPIYEMVQAAHARLRGRADGKPAGVHSRPRLGIKDFMRMQEGHPEWSLFAVKASATTVANTLAELRNPCRLHRRVPLAASERSDPVARLTAVLRIKENPWTVVLRSVFDVSAEELEGVPKEAKAISSKLKTKVVTFLFEDTSGAMAYAFYDRGRLIEEAEWECDGAMTSFRSSLRKQPEGSRFTSDFADEVFRDEGIYIPACYPRADDGDVWLAIQKPSANSVECADLLELGKIATPIHDAVTATIKARANLGV
jgi:hypothetical protein